MTRLTSLFSSRESLWLIHYCPLTVFQVSWFDLSNEVNTPLMWKLDTTMWWRQTGSSRVNCESRGPFDVRNARQCRKQKRFGEVGWNTCICMYYTVHICVGVCMCVCMCEWVCVCERERDKEGEELVFLCDLERVNKIGCVCACMKLILSSFQLTSFIQRMKWVRKWQFFGK